MNIVRGVADLLRKSSGGQGGDGGGGGGPWSLVQDKLSAPTPRIVFGNAGEEAILNTLWQRYEGAFDKAEKRKLLQVFLLHFVQTYKNWEPVNNNQRQQTVGTDDTIVGCSYGHPSDVVLVLIQEIARLTSLITELNTGGVKVESSMSWSFNTEGLYVMECATIITRSVHNCRVFSYYSGVQKITALLKAAVVQLKTLTSAVAVDEELSSGEKTRLMQKILLYVVLVISSFVGLENVAFKDIETVGPSSSMLPKIDHLEGPLSRHTRSSSKERLNWQQRAIVLVMETGGVNWLVELLRVMRRLSLKEQWIDLSLQFLTLNTLRVSLNKNPRGQNHFRSIGGLEVLLDGLGLPSSSKCTVSISGYLPGDQRNKMHVFGIFHLQILSLEVLREATFGNISNLQFLCENGRVHKLANSICWPAFMLQDLQRQVSSSSEPVSDMFKSNSSADPGSEKLPAFSALDQTSSSSFTEWSAYAVKLGKALCSFLLAPEDLIFHLGQASICQSSVPVSVAYWELAIRWIVKVLLAVFPCIKACCMASELPNHIRILANTLQHYFLCTFRKLLVSAPALLEVLREEGLWDLIFSEKFFYFGPSLEELSADFIPTDVITVPSEVLNVQEESSDVNILQAEAVSFLEFAATLNGNSNNLPECSVLLDTLEQSACNPGVSNILLNSLRRILQLALEQSHDSFRSLDAIARVLKVACIQSQELRKLNTSEQEIDGDTGGRGTLRASMDSSKSWMACLQSALELFKEYLSTVDDARTQILKNAGCIDCLFELFWEESLRKDILEHILALLKLPPSPDDKQAKLHLCSKYLEIFTRAKERETHFAELSMELLTNIREILTCNQVYYQKLFHDGECFLHIVSLLNGNLDERIGEQLVLNVLQTLTLLLTGNDDSKLAFRGLVGSGYQTLQSLLLDFCKWKPSESLLDALLDMLVDGKYEKIKSCIIKNDDVVMLFLSVLQKSSALLQHYGIDILLDLLRDSIPNRTSCSRAGVLSFLLDWFFLEESDVMISKIAKLIQAVGGHSISGKDIRKIFALLRSNRLGSNKRHGSLLLRSIHSMLKERGPEAFFEFSGSNSGIVLNTPLQWPSNKGFSFSCWLRLEDVPGVGNMGLFCFLTDNGKGCVAMIGKGQLIYESISQKRQCAVLPLTLQPSRWHFLCITHNIGRAFSGGSLLRCYIDGNPVSSEKCRYAKVSDVLTHCTIGTEMPSIYEGNNLFSVEKSSPFLGQMGPVYMFSDALSSEQIRGIYCLGPSYMYSFLSDEVQLASDISIYNGILEAKDGLTSKVIFGVNAQASIGRTLVNVLQPPDSSADKNVIGATVMEGSKLCSRRLLQEIIYCVGGVSVFFPLLTQLDRIEKDGNQKDYIFNRSIVTDKLAAEVIELVALVLESNLVNQHQMHMLSGFAILGFLFQSVPPQQLNTDTLSALKYMLNVLKNCGMSDLLVKEAILRNYLNPHIWVYASYEVQRDLYLFLLQYFENDRSLIVKLCGLPRIIDIICQFYWDKADSQTAFGRKPLLHSVTGQVIGERPSQEEIRKIRLLLLSLAEMSLRQEVSAPDIKALIAFFERSQDMVCIEDVLHMIIRALLQKTLLTSFLEQVNQLGGCQMFLNLLQRELEPIRLLGLQFLGKLLVGLPCETKGIRIFSLSVGRSKSLPENQKKGGSMIQQQIFSSISQRLFRFPLSDHLYATLFDVLLGGASPKQVLQQQTQAEIQKTKKNTSHFFLPQILECIFKFLVECKEISAREKILTDLLDLLDSNPLNIEALLEYGWMSWLATSVRLEVWKEYPLRTQVNYSLVNELMLIRSFFCIVLSHCLCSVKGGWQHLEETINFLLLNFEQIESLHPDILRDILGDLSTNLVEISFKENIFFSQPCRDSTLYLLKLIDEMLLSQDGNNLLIPGVGIYSETALDNDQPEIQKEIVYAVTEILISDADDSLLRIPWTWNSISKEGCILDDEWWNFYDKIWTLISEMFGKGSNRALPKGPASGAPSLGQRARGLVESLNIPAAEMAAVVVSGGIGNALGGKTTKNVDKAMLLRGEKCPRIVFHLIILYICRGSLERASRCVQQLIPLLPSLLISDDDQSKNRLHFFIWSLLTIRSQFNSQDDGARFHIISHLILETVNYGKTMLASTIFGREDSQEFTGSIKEAGSILNLIQRERVLATVADEAKFLRANNADRRKQLDELRVKIDEYILEESNQRKIFEDETQKNVNTVLFSDNMRKAAFHLAFDEEQQIIADKWIHVFRALVDERGPWSSNPFPNDTTTHWKLDKTEDNWRRRQKLRQNYHFNEQLCHPPTKPCNESSHQVTEQSVSSHIPEQMKRFLLKGVRGITEDGSSDPCVEPIDLLEKESGTENSHEDHNSDASRDLDDSSEVVYNRKELSSRAADNELSEVQLSIPCILVSPKRKLAGHLSIMQNILHFSCEFLVEGTGGSSVFTNFDALKSSYSCKSEVGETQKQKLRTADNIDAILSVQNQLDKIKRHRRWNISKIRAVHWTRYLLQYTAVEIFFNDSIAPVFVNFSTVKDAKHVGTLIVNTRNGLLFPRGSSKDKQGMISFVDRRIAVEMAETARERWRRREISNFEYLMILNTLAGRSYNDLTQYPVFPWILSDYSSEELDFNKSSTFRDLSKPVGALESKRFQVFEDRYHNFADPDIPSFYYGSHYSSMGIVLFYLLRLEPFTALHRNLQGGKFDHADRLFQSVEGTYNNCLSNTSDVKELIPEFFYMPEFLVNFNLYHLGVKQDGEPLTDVVLPPWAKGSPEEFIYRNREALESEYVSSNLHHWIDLVFGYKQRGKPAVEAANVFYYLTYEGAVDLDTLDDPLQRSAIEDQIANFGQTPIQIFRKKHPRRGPPIPIAHPLYFAPASITLTSVTPTTNPSSAVIFIGLVDNNIVTVNQGLTVSIKLWLTSQLQSGGNFTFSGSQDPVFGVGYDVISPRKIGSSMAENLDLGRQRLTTIKTPTDNYLISCGNWENSFQVISLTDGRTVQSIRQHKDVVSCVAVTSDGSILATGSYDTTVMVWHTFRGKFTEKKFSRGTQAQLPRKDQIISGSPFHILCGHDDIITCLFISLELDIVISGSKDGTCIFHTLREGKYVRSIQHPSGCALSKLVASQHGRLVIYAENDLSLHMYSINGKHIASMESNGRLNCMELSICGDFLVCAGDQGQIILRSMHSLDIIRKYEGVGKIITALTVTPEECFLAGTKDGCLLVYSIENPQLRRSTLSRNAKSKSAAVG